jgi:hypothetical protein
MELQKISSTWNFVGTIAPNHMALGIEWLDRHHPIIDWNHHTITLFSETCQEECGVVHPITAKLLSSSNLNDPAPMVT